MNDNSAEVRDSTIGDIANKTQNEKYVELIILKSLENLIWLEMFVLNTSLIFSQALNSHTALSLGQTTSRDWGVR
jgi:hypothetical protein